MTGDRPWKTFLSRSMAGLFPARLQDSGYDLVAALALAAVAVPEQIATARLAGAPPAAGLVVFIAASLGFFLWGANRQLSVGADSTIAPIFAASIAALSISGSPHYLALTATLAFLVGAIVTAAGVLRMGWIARLLSVPVITGFLAGIAVHIAVSQMPALLGISDGHGEFFPTLSNLFRNIAHSNPWTFAIGVGVFAAILVGEKINIRMPSALFSMMLATLSVWLFDLTSKGVATLGNVQAVNFTPSLPQVTISDIGQLLPVALAVSLVVIIQTATTSRSFPDSSGADDLNRDLVGVGVGNILVGFLAGFPANSSPPRTAIVSESGGRSRSAGFCAAVIVAMFLVLGLDLLAMVPLAALAGLLLFVAQRIFRFNTIRLIAKQSPAEFVLLIATATAIIVMPIATGVGIGVGLSLLYGVWAIVQARAVEFEKVPGSTVWWPIDPNMTSEKQAGIVVVGFQAPLFFLNAGVFRQSLDYLVRHAPQPVHAIILEASSIVELDYSGAQILIALIGFWKHEGIDFYVARLESIRVQKAFAKFGILACLGRQRIFHSVDDAIRHLRAS